MERRFKGLWLPIELLEHPELNALEKLLFAEVDSLDTTERGCYASNAYLGAFLGVKERQASRMVGHLLELKLVTSHMAIKPDRSGNERILHAFPAVLQGGIVKNDYRGSSQNCLPSIHSNQRVVGTTGQAPSGLAGSDLSDSLKFSNQIASKLGLPLSTKKQLAERHVLSSLSILDRVLADLYEYYRAYTPESLNKQITESVAWLVRNKKKKPRKDQLLFIIEWLDKEVTNLIERPLDGLEKVSKDSPKFSEFSRSEYARFLIGIWSPESLS